MAHHENDIDRILDAAFDITSDAIVRNHVKKSFFRHFRNGYDVVKICRKLPIRMENAIREQCSEPPLRAQLLYPPLENESPSPASWEQVDYLNTLSAFVGVLFDCVNATLCIEGVVSTPHRIHDAANSGALLHCARQSVDSFTRGEPLRVQKVLGQVQTFLGIESLVLQYVVPPRETLKQIAAWCSRIQVYIGAVEHYARKLQLFRTAALSAQFIENTNDLRCPTVRIVRWNLTLLKRSLFALLQSSDTSIASAPAESVKMEATNLRRVLSFSNSVVLNHSEEVVLHHMRELSEARDFRRCKVPHIPTVRPTQSPQPPSAIPIVEDQGYFCNHRTFARVPVADGIGAMISQRLNPSFLASFRVPYRSADGKQKTRARLSVNHDATALHYQRKTHYDIVLQSLIVQFIEQSDRADGPDHSVAYIRTFLNALEDCNFDRITQLHLVSKLYTHLEMVLCSSQPSLFPVVFDILVNVILAIHLRSRSMFPGAIHAVLGVSLNILWYIFAADRKYDSLWISAMKFIRFVYPEGSSLHPLLLRKLVEESSDIAEMKAILIDTVLGQSYKITENSYGEFENSTYQCASMTNHGTLQSLGGIQFLQFLYTESSSYFQQLRAFSLLFWSIMEASTRKAMSNVAHCHHVQEQNLSIFRQNAAALLRVLNDAEFPQHAQSLFVHFPDNAVNFVRDFCYHRLGRRVFPHVPILRTLVKGIAQIALHVESAEDLIGRRYPLPTGYPTHMKQIAPVVLYLINSDRAEMRSLSEGILGKAVVDFTKRCLEAANGVVNITPQRTDNNSVVVLFDDGTINTARISGLSDVFIDRTESLVECIRAMHDVLHSICTSAHVNVRILFFRILEKLVLCVKAHNSSHRDRILTLLNVNFAYYYHVNPAEKSSKVLFATFKLLLGEIVYHTHAIDGEQQKSAVSQFYTAFRHHLRNHTLSANEMAEKICAGELAVDHSLLTKLSLPVLFLLFRVVSIRTQQLAKDPSCEIDKLNDFEIRRYVLLFLVLNHPESHTSVEASVWLALMEESNPIISIVAAREFLRTFQERHQQLFDAWECIFHFQPEAYSNGLFRFFHCLLHAVQLKQQASDFEGHRIAYRKPCKDVPIVESDALTQTAKGFMKVYYLKRMYEAKILNRI